MRPGELWRARSSAAVLKDEHQARAAALMRRPAMLITLPEAPRQPARTDNTGAQQTYSVRLMSMMKRSSSSDSALEAFLAGATSVSLIGVAGTHSPERRCARNRRAPIDARRTSSGFVTSAIWNDRRPQRAAISRRRALDVLSQRMSAMSAAPASTWAILADAASGARDEDDLPRDIEFDRHHGVVSRTACGAHLNIASVRC